MLGLIVGLPAFLFGGDDVSPTPYPLPLVHLRSLHVSKRGEGSGMFCSLGGEHGGSLSDNEAPVPIMLLLISDATHRDHNRVHTLSPPVMPWTDIRSGDRIHVTVDCPRPHFKSLMFVDNFA